VLLDYVAEVEEKKRNQNEGETKNEVQEKDQEIQRNNSFKEEVNF
jgi:hypothetical protein